MPLFDPTGKDQSILDADMIKLIMRGALGVCANNVSPTLSGSVTSNSGGGGEAGEQPPSEGSLPTSLTTESGGQANGQRLQVLNEFLRVELLKVGGCILPAISWDAMTLTSLAHFI